MSTLFFGNVSFDSTVESIQAFIAHYGIQGQVELPRSRAGSRRRNGGFALVTVPAEAVDAAIATLHDKECDGRRVTVKISRESGGLGGQRSAERGTSAAAPAPRTRAPREPRAPRENVGGFSAGGAARAPRAPREPRADRPPRAERAPRPVELSRSAGPGQKTLFLGNLAFASTVESVAAFIAANGVQVNAGDIELPASTNGRSRGFALVYVSEGALAAGIAALNDKECDGRVLRVTEARESGGLGGSRSAERA